MPGVRPTLTPRIGECGNLTHAYWQLHVKYFMIAVQPLDTTSPKRRVLGSNQVLLSK
jgi:hypothetical protein